MKKCYILCAVIVLTFSLVSCDDEKEELTGNAILRFEVEGRLGRISFNELTIEILETVDITNVKPIIKISEGATISPASGEAQDFSNAVIYTVTSESGVSRSFEVKPMVLRGLQMFAIHHRYETYSATVDHINRQIDVEADFRIMRDLQSQNFPALVDFELYPEFSSSLTKDSQIDLDNPGEITISSGNKSFSYSISVKNSSNKLYSVKLEPDPIIPFSTASFSYPDHLIGITGEAVIVRTLSDVDLTNIVFHAFTHAENAIVSPDPTKPLDLSVDRNFTITSETGSQRRFTLRVIKEDLLMAGDMPGDTIRLSTATYEVATVYEAVSPAISAILRNINDNSLIDCAVINYSGSRRFHVGIRPVGEMPPGNYRISFKLQNGATVQHRRVVIVKTR
jgi:hypothetical protein